MEIRVLNASDLSEAVALKIKSWTEELVGKAENTLILETELAYWLNWMQSAEENQDVRLLLGAFDGRKLVDVFIGPHGQCSHCHNEKEGQCRFRKSYTIGGTFIEKCNLSFTHYLLKHYRSCFAYLKHFIHIKKGKNPYKEVQIWR